MKTYISMLRGINVSGHKLIKMKSLQEMFENLGFRSVRTYIQSGNIVFEGESTQTEKLEKMISEEILNFFGFEVPVIALEKKEMKNISANNMFISERGEDISRLHVTFLSKEPDKKLAESIRKEEYLPAVPLSPCPLFY